MKPELTTLETVVLLELINAHAESGSPALFSAYNKLQFHLASMKVGA